MQRNTIIYNNLVIEPGYSRRILMAARGGGGSGGGQYPERWRNRDAEQAGKKLKNDHAKL